MLPNFSLMLSKGVWDWNTHPPTDKQIEFVDCCFFAAASSSSYLSRFFFFFFLYFVAVRRFFPSIPSLGSLYLIRHLFSWACLSVSHSLSLVCCSSPRARLSRCSKLEVAQGKKESAKNEAFLFDWTNWPSMNFEICIFSSLSLSLLLQPALEMQLSLLFFFSVALLLPTRRPSHASSRFKSSSA